MSCAWLLRSSLFLCLRVRQIMNMIGSPRNAEKALEAGVDLLCAQGTEGGGHTGDVATSVLLPMVVDLARGKRSPLTGKPIQVVAAGGIVDGGNFFCFCFCLPRVHLHATSSRFLYTAGCCK